MNSITRNTAIALVAACLTSGLAACGGSPEAPVQQIELLDNEATVTNESPTSCPDYLRGWERTGCDG
jgi:hypothetical protein